MRRYTFGFLRDYFSGRWLLLTRGLVGRKVVYSVSNGARADTLVGIPALVEYAQQRGI